VLAEKQRDSASLFFIFFSMRRFFYDPAQESSEHLLIEGAEARHISTVLRLRLGGTAELLDGAGRVLVGQIERISADSVLFRILSRRREPESRSPLTLAAALLKGKKMDLLVQKAAELGVHSFIPLITRYCEPQGRDKQMIDRWQRIMLEACKQCGRPWLMRISTPLPLHELEIPQDSLKIMPWEKETVRSFSDINIKAGQSALLLIGPEGGFHPEEVDFAKQCGFNTVSLGPRILRAETAVLTAAVLVQHGLGNLAPAPERYFTLDNGSQKDNHPSSSGAAGESSGNQ
jgi:16S rRNA (uracil1498-N3)-methyltransferase